MFRFIVKMTKSVTHDKELRSGIELDIGYFQQFLLSLKCNFLALLSQPPLYQYEGKVENFSLQQVAVSCFRHLETQVSKLQKP